MEEGRSLRVIGVARLLHVGLELFERAARTGTAATTKLNCQDFGISWSRTLDGGGLVVSDEVAVTIDIELVSAPPSSKQIAPAARLRSRPSRVYSGLHPAQPGLPSLSGIGNGMAGSLEDSG
jgi:hypothetical protein